MKNHLTIKEMSRAIVFAATDGHRTLDNYVDGMFVIEGLGRFFYRWRIEQLWADMVNGKTTARATLASIKYDLKLRALDSPQAARMVKAIETIMN